MLFCFITFAFLVYEVDSRVEKYKFDINCYSMKCNSSVKVCGIRAEGEGFRIRLFQDECALLNYKCAVKDNFGYNITSMSYCSQVFRYEPDIEPSIHDPCKKYDCLHPADDVQVCGLRQDGKGFRIRMFRNKCELWEHNCEKHVNFTITDFYICNGLELPAAENKQLETTDLPYTNNALAEDILHNSEDNNAKDDDDPHIYDIEQNLVFSKDNTTMDDDFYMASEHFSDNFTSISENDLITNRDNDFTSVDDFAKESDKQSNVPGDYGDRKTELGQVNLEPETTNENINLTNDNLDTNKESKNIESKNLIVVRGLLQDKNSVNDTINQFFSATHVFDLPVKEMPTDYLNETTRRRLIKIAGPLNVFIPLLSIPQNISEDIEHRPTLNSCFHKCPKKCPATYAPVCGIPGRRAREPTLMFLNHCFMDVAQCKQFYENKSPTSISSAYTETTFVFCLGDAMNYMYHFLPLLKTLQHMGRLPKKGHYQYRLQNFKIFNNLLNIKNPNLMG